MEKEITKDNILQELGKHYDDHEDTVKFFEYVKSLKLKKSVKMSQQYRVFLDLVEDTLYDMQDEGKDVQKWLDMVD